MLANGATVVQCLYTLCFPLISDLHLTLNSSYVYGLAFTTNVNTTAQWLLRIRNLAQIEEVSINVQDYACFVSMIAYSMKPQSHSNDELTNVNVYLKFNHYMHYHLRG